MRSFIVASFVSITSLVFAQAPQKSFTEKLDGIQTSSKELTKNASTDNSSVGQSGSMNTSVPLVNITSRTMSFPLQLSYASGIKVDQQSGPVGLGWAMPVGSIVRDYGAFEPDYTSKHGEMTMVNSNGGQDGWLNPAGDAINPSTHNQVLGCNTLPSFNQTMPMSDEYHVSVPGFLGNTFWNGAAIDQNHDWSWSTYENWKVQGVEKTFTIDQEFSRVNELNLPSNGVFDINSSYANAIGVFPYVENGEAHIPSSNNPTLSELKVVYDDFGSFIITDDSGVQYVFGRALRGQKFVFSDDPYWSTKESTDFNAANGNFWKVDFIAEWLLTEIRSVDYVDANNNGIADDADAGDWIRFEYTEATKTVGTTHYGSGPELLSSEVPMYREWSSFSQTDQASSLMRERAYLAKIVTPTQYVDLTISQRYDVNHDYFNKPANKLNANFFYEDLKYSNSGQVGTEEDFDINYPIETMKYDSILIYSRLIDKTLYPNESLLTGAIVLNYAAQGSSDQLAVSDYLIRNNDNTPKLDGSGNILGTPSETSFDLDDYNNGTDKRGKTTLLSVDFLDGDMNTSEKASFEFEYGYNPSYSEIHKRSILKKWAYPSLRQSSGLGTDQNFKPSISLDYTELKLNSLGQPTSSISHTGLATSEFLIDFPYKEKYYRYNGASIPELEAYVENQTVPNLGLITELIPHPVTANKDQFGFFYSDQCSSCSEAWSLTKITYPTGGVVSFEYEPATYDITNDPNSWSFDESEIPLVKDYNTLAKDRSISQDLYNDYGAHIGAYSGYANYKQLTASFEVELPQSYGIRLSKKSVDDRINPIVELDYAYGTGHFTSLPSDFISNYLSGFNQFLIRENQRHQWENDIYTAEHANANPGFRNDYTEKMSYAANSNIALDDYRSTFYYAHIDNKLSDQSFTRSYYNTPTGTINSSIPDYNVYCIKFPIFGRNGRYVLGGNVLTKEPILPIKSEFYEANAGTPYKTELSTYTYTVVDSKELYFNYGAPNNILEIYNQTFENWLPLNGSYTPAAYVMNRGVSVGPFITPISVHQWTTAVTGTANGNAFVYNKDHFLPFTSEIQAVYGLYKKWATTKLQLQSTVSEYKGMTSTREFTYDLVDYNLKSESTESSYTNDKYITTYEYVHETYLSTTVFDDLNIKKLPTRTNTYRNTVSPSTALSTSMITYDYTNYSVPRLLNTYQYEDDLTDVDLGTFTIAAPYNVASSNNPNWRQSESDLMEYNPSGSLISGRTNRLFNKSISGSNMTTSKASFAYTENAFDATYSGFEDFHGRNHISDWNTESYSKETWFTEEITSEDEPAFSMHSHNNTCNASLPSANTPFQKELNVVTVDNITGLNIGDIVEVEIQGSQDASPNGLNYSWSVETTVTDIQLRLYNPTGSGSGTIPELNNYILCFSDIIEFPSSTEYLTGLYGGFLDPIDERASTTIEQTIVTKKNPTYHLSNAYQRTGVYSYKVTTQKDETVAFKKSAIRPVKIENITSTPTCSDPELGYDAPYVFGEPKSCFWGYEASLWLKYDFDVPQSPISEPVPNLTIDANADAIYRRGTLTENDNGSKLKVICDVWNADRTFLIEQRVFYIENISTAWQQFTLNVPIRKGSEKYLDVYVQNERQQLEGTNPAYYKALFADDICVYPTDSKYNYSTIDKFGNTTFATNNNDVFAQSVFDSKGRNTQQKNVYGSVMSENEYFDQPNWVNQMNHVTGRQWIDNGSYNETRYYLDGFGKTKQVQVSDITRDARIVSETNLFNSKGQTYRSYKPYALSDATFTNRYDTDFDVKSQNLYGSYHAFTDVSYEALPEEKLSTVIPPRTNAESAITASQSDYISLGNITHPYMLTNNVFPAGELLVHETVNALGNKVWTYMDNLGRVILEEHEIGNTHIQNADGSISDAGTGYTTAKTWFVYDGASRIVKVVDPTGKLTSYTYNSLGLVVEKESADKGISTIRYDKYGQIRFVRNAKDIAAVSTNDWETDQFKYVKYDEWGRTIESGFMPVADFNPATIPFTPHIYFDDYSYINDQEFPLSTMPMIQLHQEMTYDDTRQQLSSEALLEDITYSEHTMNANATWSAGKEDKKEYTYMADGQIGRIKYSYDGLATHTFEPQFNGLRMPIGKKYIHPTNSAFDFEWSTELDNLGRLAVNTTTHNSVTQEHGKYYYDVLGNLLMKGIGTTTNPSDPHIDYQTYKNDIRDQLEHFASKHFRFGLEHNENGNITSQYWSNAHLDDATNNLNKYEYTYDKMDRLTGADYKATTVAATTFDYYDAISNNLPDDFFCGVNEAAFMEVINPILDVLNANIENRIRTRVSSKAITALNTLKVEYLDNNIQYQDMSTAEQDVFLTNYITAVQAARGDAFGYEQYEAENANDQIHLSILAQNSPAPFYMKYTKLLLNSISYNPTITNCDPNPNSTVYGYLPTFPYPTIATNTQRYDAAYWYTENGNITDLNRNDDQGVKTQQDYVYGNTTTNELTDVTWSVPSIPNETHSYDYDLSGNLLNDSRNGVTNIDYISYNDMPQEITNNTGTIKYRYNAEQMRVSKDLGVNDKEYYFEGIVVDQLGDVKSYQTSEGYAVPLSGNVDYFYNINDWLGTNRGVMKADGAVLNAYDHYPFGMRMPARHVVMDQNGNRYQFTGHEYDEETKYGYHGARYYNRELGKYMSVDPLAQQFQGWSSYNYVMGSPVMMIDPDGRAPQGEYFDIETKEFLGSDGMDDGMEYQVDGREWRALAQSSTWRRLDREGDSEGKKFRASSIVIRSTPHHIYSSLAGCDGARISKSAESCTSTSASSNNSVGTFQKTEEASNNNESASIVDSYLSNLLLGTSGGLGLLNDANQVLMANNRGLSLYQLAKNKTLKANLLVRSNGAMNNGKYFKASKYVSNSKSLSKKLPLINIISLGNDYRMTLKTGNSGYLNRGLLSTIAGYVPYAGTSLSIYISSKPVSSFQLPKYTGPTTCFISGTEIKMYDGTSKNIEDIKVGDRILNVDVDLMKVEEDVVEMVPSKTKSYQIVKASFSNGIENSFSPAHPYWVKGKGWCVVDLVEAETELNFEVNKLEEGDTVLYYDGINLVEIMVTSITITDEYIEMYNVEFVKKNHSFFANGILVHNKYLEPEE